MATPSLPPSSLVSPLPSPSPIFYPLLAPRPAASKQQLIQKWPGRPHSDVRPSSECLLGAGLSPLASFSRLASTPHLVGAKRSSMSNQPFSRQSVAKTIARVAKEGDHSAPTFWKDIHDDGLTFPPFRFKRFWRGIPAMY